MVLLAILDQCNTFVYVQIAAFKLCIQRFAQWNRFLFYLNFIRLNIINWIYRLFNNQFLIYYHSCRISNINTNKRAILIWVIGRWLVGGDIRLVLVKAFLGLIVAFFQSLMDRLKWLLPVVGRNRHGIF